MVTCVTEREEKAEQSAECSDTKSDSGVLSTIHLLLNELYRLSSDRIRLAALETRRAGESLVTMIVAAVMVAFMMGSAWLGLMAAAVLGMLDKGIVPGSAILITVVLNLFFALILCAVIGRKRRYLEFPATLRSFKTTDSGRRVTKKS